MSRDINPFGLRLAPSLRDSLEASAELNGRSLNSEICLRLESSFYEQKLKDRDYFAANALSGLAAQYRVTESTNDDSIAKYAFALADAMLEARNK